MIKAAVTFALSKVACLLAVCAMLSACPHPMPVGPAVEHAVDCSKRSIGDQAIGLIPAVNSCLVALVTLNPTPCLLALIDPAKNIAEDDLACIVRSQGAEFAAAARANPGDDVSKRAGDAALEFLNARRISFEDH